MTAKELASKIEHTLLRPDATEADVVRLCEEAAEHDFYGVCVNPGWVRAAWRALDGMGRRKLPSRIKIISVVGFPFGAIEAESKRAEANLAVFRGADEIDMVMNVGLLRGGELAAVAHEIEMVVKGSDGRPVKVILECCYLTDEEKVTAARIAMEAGAAFVKTSTGFGMTNAKDTKFLCHVMGACVDDVRLLKRTVGERVGIKAAGGIRDLAMARAMLAAGADRLGCSASVAIMRELAAE